MVPSPYRGALLPRFVLCSALCAAAVHAGSAPALPPAQEDQRRTEARPYPHALGPVQGIRIRSTRYFDADNRPCAAPPPKSRAVTPRHVRTFLRKAVPVSQIDVMNYHGAFGECMSDWVDVTFADGRRVRMTFAADSGVAYLAPLVDGKEGEVYFYVCEDCGR
ncbi:hypothetical protein QRO11_18185 [Paracidovorax citrulli]|nr:hypothetical protein [Paracidovorax citrulli]ATG95202.1 hypothetical protein CQB05_15195 [Paracidovorax citrulli]PVY65911.1 hypothetical protein C8E08_3296 [Paracidovorax citrulli]REG69916.1 hypothetical protein C8E07_3089 [Paracidovorax citrulli]RLJ94470.1 hypothetical protein C8E06_3088 [Paracidovorax citrulli]UMT84580.1 hypothetical protein FRC75_15100 [Paracidovorax citrulli]